MELVYDQREDESYEKEQLVNDTPNIESWYTINRKDYFFNFSATKQIPSGLYSMIFTQNNGFGLSKLDYQSEEYFHLPSLPHEQIIKDLQTFWDNKPKYIKYKLNPKRGIILHGEPGCGKTSLIYLLVDEMKKRNGISIYFSDPGNWVEIAKLLRKVEPTRPLICVIEDLDLVIKQFGEQVFLNFLDGLNQIDNVVYIGTTNNLKDIPDRIKNRPSRFDEKYEIKKPNDDDRRVFFTKRVLEEDLKKYDIEKLVKDTNTFTMAHLKEVFISLYILEHQYDEVLKRLKKVKMDSPIGFNIENDNEY